MSRASVCVGVNRAGTMPALKAAADGAAAFAKWARAQGCDTTLITDDHGKVVTLRDVSTTVRTYVNKGTYSQIIVYFSGHGILKAPDTEYWLLSEAPDDPNEAVNLAGSIANARSSGIPHIVFVSDACRSGADSPQLRAITGGVLFPSRSSGPPRPEIDVFYATQPGDPAYEVVRTKATRGYQGIFTTHLLRAVTAPAPSLVETINVGAVRVSIIPSWTLKPYLEATVPVRAAAFDVRLRQSPEVRVESHPPKFFARLHPGAATPPPPPGPAGPAPTARPPRPPSGGAPAAAPTSEGTIESMIQELGATHFYYQAPTGETTASLSRQARLLDEVERLESTRGRGHFETTTGFSIHGSDVVFAYASQWQTQPFHDQASNAWHVRLEPRTRERANEGDSLLLQFSTGVGTALAILPGFVGSVVMDDRRLISVNYVPSDNTERYLEYRQRSDDLERMKAFAAVAARNGRFVVAKERASALANRIRQLKGIDPTLGVYAAYAYAQAGAFEDVVDVFRYMLDDSLPVPFDVAMLATRFSRDASVSKHRVAPLCPMLSQGWALLENGDPLFEPIHARLQGHLVPSLWTSFDEEGVMMARDFLTDQPRQ